MLSPNKKIAVSAVAIFILSFASMVLFLDAPGASGKGKGHQANVFDSHKPNSEHIESGVQQETARFGLKKIDEIALFQTSKFPTVITDKELNVRSMRNDFAQLVGEEKMQEFKEQNLFNFVNSDDVPELASLNLKLLDNGLKVEAMGPFRMQSEEGEKLVMLSANPIKNSRGKVDYIIFQFRDLSDKIELIIGENEEKIEVKEPEVEETKTAEPEVDEELLELDDANEGATDETEDKNEALEKISDHLSGVF